MSDQRSQKDPGPVQASVEAADSRALLERILVAVESNQKQGRVELMIAIVISMATLGSTWCGYQSQLWSSASSSLQEAADAAEREAEESVLIALQLRTQHGLQVLEYWSALRTGDKLGAQMILDHMPKMVREATEASVREGILKNPEVTGPLQRSEYKLAEEDYAAKKKSEAKNLNTQSAKASDTSTTYVLRTLMFASVLFFGGIGGTFDDRRIQTALAFVALTLLVVTISLLIPLPAYTG